MGALPKRRIARSRRGERRSHLALTTKSLVTCSQCRKPRLPHRVCPNCGYYKGEEVVKSKSEEAKKK